MNTTEMLHQCTNTHIYDANPESLAVTRTIYTLILKDITSCQ